MVMSDTTDIQHECYACADKDDEIRQLTDELINLEQVAKDRYCEMQTEIERLTALRKEDRNDMQRLSDQLDYLSDQNAKLQAVVDALRGLLADTQHSKHYCGDEDCPVDIARKAIAALEAK